MENKISAERLEKIKKAALENAAQSDDLTLRYQAEDTLEVCRALANIGHDLTKSSD